MLKLAGERREADFTASANHEIPMLNTVVYDVLFPDGAVKQYSANIIAENMLRQVDVNWHQTQLLEEIHEHKNDSSAA